MDEKIEHKVKTKSYQKIKSIKFNNIKRKTRYFIAHFPNDPEYWKEFSNLVDGVLMSQKNLHTKKGKSTKLMKEMEERGVHETLEIPRDIPFMLDSGAFQYMGAEWEELPIIPEKLLEMYRKLKVNFGVHPDWPITNDLNEKQVKKRYKTTIQNAEIMMELLQKEKYNGLQIIAVAQGNSPFMYKFVKIGYKLIGIGGLAPLSQFHTDYDGIFKRINAVTSVTSKYKDINVHLFGIGNINVLKKVLNKGVNSFDNATPTMAAIKGDLILSNPHYRRFNILKHPEKANGLIPCGCVACNKFGKKILRRGKREWNFGRAIHNYAHYKAALNGLQNYVR